MKKAATHLARQGRGSDDTLMHVTRREAGILGLLHPDGKLPHNPATGLPEAGWFDTILPIVVGLGATALTGGAAAPYALAAGAAASGATKTAMTGDLGQGIMTGLLSYGAGSALQGLSGGAEAAGAAVPGAQAGTDGLANSTSALMNPVGETGAFTGQSLSNGAPQLSFDTSGLMNNLQMPSSDLGSLGDAASSFAPTAPSPTSVGLDNITSARGMDLGSGLSGTTPATTGLQRLQNIPTDMSNQFSKIGENLSTDPAGTLGRTFLDSPMKTTLPLAAGLYGTMYANPDPLDVPKEPTKEELEAMYPEQFPEARTVLSPPAGYNPGVDPEFNYFRYGSGMASGGQVLMGNHDALYKEGGIASANPGAATKANIEAEAKMALLGEHPNGERREGIVVEVEHLKTADVVEGIGLDAGNIAPGEVKEV